MRVGFIGLGAMGRPMAANIIKGGYRVTVYDTNPAAMDALSAAGATAAHNHRELAQSSDLLITILPRPEDVVDVALGPDGLAADLRSGAVFVDMSTSDPPTAQQLAAALGERGVYAVDCPVGRTVTHAEAGTLLLLAGGSDEAIDLAQPVLLCMGDELVRCGEAGAGQAMKLVNNMLAITVCQGVGEALAVGLRAGLPLDLISTVTSKTMAQTAMLDTALPAKAFAGDLSPGFALRLAEKDIGLATRLAERSGVPVPVAERARHCCAELVAGGYADYDISALVAAQTGLVPVTGHAEPTCARGLRLHSADSVATLLSAVAAGDQVVVDGGGEPVNVTAVDDVPAGHKLALTELAGGDVIRKYGGEVIGVAARDIRCGEHVHEHNVRSVEPGGRP